jgi:hypothetical protein
MTGVGSLLSDRLPVERRALWSAPIGLVIAVTLVVAAALIQPLMDATIRHGIATRACMVIAFTASIAMLLGTCFPIGMRLVRRVSEDALPWMWGLNGSAGVLSSILAVALSMWAGIHTTLQVAALCYAALVPCAIALAGFAARPLERGGPGAR